MAMSKGRADFDRLAQQNRQSLMKNRGAKSPFANIDADPGLYYARIMKNPLGVIEVEKKDSSGTKTGFKEPCMQAKLQVSIVCSADPSIPPSALERFKGSSGFIRYNLPLNDDEATARYYGDLALIGIDTNGICIDESEITDPENQYTLGQISDYLEQTKPFCQIAVVLAKDGSGVKFINYRGSAEQGDIENLLGHPIDDAALQVIEEDSEVAYNQVAEAPFDATVIDVGAAIAEDEWEQVGVNWHNKTQDTWHDESGVQIEDPTIPTPAPKKGPPFGAKVVPTVSPRPTPGVRPAAAPKPSLGAARPGLRPGAKR